MQHKNNHFTSICSKNFLGSQILSASLIGKYSPKIIKKYRNQRTTIVQHIHDISPTGHVANQNDPLLPHECPACRKPYEDNKHVIICPHASRRLWHCITIQQVRQKQESISDPHLLDILQDGITRYHNNHDLMPHEAYPNRYTRLITEHNKIGWDQLYKGRWSASWGMLQDEYKDSCQA